MTLKESGPVDQRYRIGVVSIFDTANVGNRLQSYALHRALSMLGYSPWVIRNIPEEYWRRHEYRDLAPRGIQRRIRAGVKRWWRRTPLWLNSLPGVSRNAVRSASLYPVGRYFASLFRRRNLTRFTYQEMDVHPPLVTSVAVAREEAQNFDAFVAGSDQIWNPSMRHGSGLDFLVFAEPQKRVVYAASMGVAGLSNELVDVYKDSLKGTKHISLREASGVEIVRRLTAEAVEVVADPTLLVTADEWSRLADLGRPISATPFVATYLLYRNEPATRSKIAATAGGAGLRVYDILRPPVGPQMSSAGIPEFLRAIRDAEYVVTDSFHATVFSVIFGKKICLVRRGVGQDSRVESLLLSLGFAPGDISDNLDGVPSSLNRTQVLSNLELLRDDSLKWLEEALSAACR